MNKLLFEGTEWDMELLDKMWAVIDNIGKNQLKLDYYEPQIEIITAEQMLDAYSSHALPQLYNHWSFGKSFVKNEASYKKGQSGLAYEVVINTNPSIAYLMETNTATLQALTMAHAVCGHGSFFKTNYLFKDWTDADSILDYLTFAKKYINMCEEKYGEERVEKLLDACHSLQSNAIDKYKKPRITEELKRNKNKEWLKYTENTFNDLWRTIPEPPKWLSGKYDSKEVEDNLPCAEENLLYFIEKNSPILEDWEKEIVRIIRKIAQYFYPQRQTSLLNEGFACIIHHTIMTELNIQGYLSDGSYLEFLDNHAAVIKQYAWDHKHYRGLNVYALGYAMLSDVKRICLDPTPEDYKWFPEICNTNWIETIKYIVANYRDESFILQYLSPKVIRDLRLFSISLDEENYEHPVSAIHDDEDVKFIRQKLAEQYDISRAIPQIEITGADLKGDRSLYITHYTKDGQLLEYDYAKETMQHIHKLWGFKVIMAYKNIDGTEIEDV